MISFAKRARLATVVGGFITLTSSAAAQDVRNMIGAVSGGLMSPHVELRLDLSSGVFHLVEPSSDTSFQPVVTRDGHISDVALADLRAKASLLLATGFKTAECEIAERRQRLRNDRLARRGILVVETPNMDFQAQFWVNLEGKSASAPTNEQCWTPEGIELRRAAFDAVHRATSIR